VQLGAPRRKMKSMTETRIDVWNVETFDKDLLAELCANAELIRNYLVIDKNNFLEHQTSDPIEPYPTNPYAASYLRFVKDVGQDMEARTIRAWHYTRLTDAETDTLRNTGIFASTLETIRRRLDAQVAAGVFSAKIADALFARSPFHHDKQSSARSNKFWMTSQPVGIKDGGVTPLLGSWGGEAVYFWLEDAMLEELGIGKPRVLEMAVPLDATRHAYSAGRSVVATFGRTLGCDPDTGAFDLYATRSLGAEAVLAIHTEGEAVFSEIAKGYPTEFFRAVRQAR
jgi:hypothetical protein